MKNYLDLLDIDSRIRVEMELESNAGHAEVSVNGRTVFQGAVDKPLIIVKYISLLDPVSVRIKHQNVNLKSLKFDDWQARPQYAWDDGEIYRLETEIPFYQWLHSATSQGWLLSPINTSKS